MSSTRQIKYLVFILVPLCFLVCGPSADKQELGTIKMVVGKAKHFDAQTGSWKPVEVNSTVNLGDSLKTGHESRIEIGFGSNTINAGENTKVSATEIEKENKKVLQVYNCHGTVLSDIQKLARGRDSYEVKTPTSVAAIRGTHFCVMFSLSLGYTDVSVLGGKVWVFNPHVKTPVVVLPGFYTSIYFRRAPFKPKQFNYGQWKKFSRLLHPKTRGRFKKKYKIKTPLMKGIMGPKGFKGPKGKPVLRGRKAGTIKGKSPLKGIFKGKTTPKKGKAKPKGGKGKGKKGK